jgi:hypothetical protein
MTEAAMEAEMRLIYLDWLVKTEAKAKRSVHASLARDATP